MKDTKSYVDSLFEGYEENAGLEDFKEELKSNLDDKISNLIKKGIDDDTAFARATAELGDISAIADEISLKKKQEMLGEAFMDIKHYMPSRRVAAYVGCGLLLAFGIITALIALFAQGFDDFSGVEIFSGSLIDNSHRFSGFFGVLLPFVPASVAWFTWLGLTQELPSKYPLSWKRALWYALGILLLVSGLMLFPLTYFSTGTEYSLIGALATLIPFELPAAGLLVFLVLTEKDRRKPWMKLRHEMQKQYDMFNDPETAARFGLFSGAIWMGAAALFVLFGFLIGFRYSWVVFLFAIAVQLVVQAMMMKKKGEEK